MKKVNLLLIVILLLSSNAWSQTVPKEMKIGSLKLTLTESARKQIQNDVNRLTRSQAYHQILIDRMSFFFPVIERVFKANGIPDEIKYLAVQESALISDAVSSANAVGFWQFKDFTAREVGLRVDRKVDERLNIVSASKGASKYLNTNFFYFKNWVYAIMAYNTGRGGAKKYLNPSKFGAKRMTIDKNTHWYVRKFLAHVVAFTPDRNKPHSKKLWLHEDKGANKSLDFFAKKHKVSSEDIKERNKWLKTSRVPDDKSYTIIIPKTGSRPKKTPSTNKKPKKPLDKIEEPKDKKYPTELIAGISSNQRMRVKINGLTAIVSRNSDKIGTLAKKLNIKEKKFRKYNDLTSNSNLIPNRFYYTRKKFRKGKVPYHITEKGETLWEISQKEGIRLARLAKLNRMQIVDEPKAGRILFLRKKRPASTPIDYYVSTKKTSKGTQKPKKKKKKYIVPEDEIVKIDTTAYAEIKDEIVTPDPKKDVIKVTPQNSSEERKKVKIHTVAKGESLWGISRKYNVKVADILRWNELENANQISIGQNIRVKAPIEEASKDKKIILHTVQPKETVYAISRKYGMTVDEVADLNKLKNFALEVGQQLKVYNKK